MSYYYFYFERGFAVMEKEELKKLHAVFIRLTDEQKKHIVDLAEKLTKEQKSEISASKKGKAQVKGGK
jgi:Zn-dependent M16 (insulinase) family peptidase